MLKDARLVYLILYVTDMTRSRDFYERTLGFRVLEEDGDSVKYDGGHIILLLNRAADHGITLAQSHDSSTDIVFLVDDLERTRAAMQSRGVTFVPTVKYVIGSIADFYDPDGHWFTLYEPSKAALDWPSGKKIQSVLAARARRLAGVPERQLVEVASMPSSKTDHGDSNGNGKGNGDPEKMDGKELIYLFLFVRNSMDTAQFYRDRLGLVALEGGPCSQLSTGDEEGVVKYDAGGLMIATHHTEGTEYTDGKGPVQVSLDEHSCPPRQLDPVHTQGVAPVFHVEQIDSKVEELAGKGIQFLDGVARLGIGGVAKFLDPSGHLFYLYEPSKAALGKPSGRKITQILAEAL